MIPSVSQRHTASIRSPQCLCRDVARLIGEDSMIAAGTTCRLHGGTAAQNLPQTDQTPGMRLDGSKVSGK